MGFAGANQGQRSDGVSRHAVLCPNKAALCRNNNVSRHAKPCFVATMACLATQRHTLSQQQCVTPRNTLSQQQRVTPRNAGLCQNNGVSRYAILCFVVTMACLATQRQPSRIAQRPSHHDIESSSTTRGLELQFASPSHDHKGERERRHRACACHVTHIHRGGPVRGHDNNITPCRN